MLVVVTVRAIKIIDLRVCHFVGTNMRVGIYVDSKPKWLGLGQDPEIRSPTENRRVISIVPGLHRALVTLDAKRHIKKVPLDAKRHTTRCR